jgi:hypothetical protein
MMALRPLMSVSTSFLPESPALASALTLSCSACTESRMTARSASAAFEVPCCRSATFFICLPRSLRLWIQASVASLCESWTPKRLSIAVLSWSAADSVSVICEARPLSASPTAFDLPDAEAISSK